MNSIFEEKTLGQLQTPVAAEMMQNESLLKNIQEGPTVLAGLNLQRFCVRPTS